jgi:putative membrane protein
MPRLTPEDRARVEAAVDAAERRTSAELAVVVAETSDDYAGFPLLWAASIALFAGGVLSVLRPVTWAPTLFTAEAVIFLVSALVLFALPRRAWLAPTSVRTARAQWMAELQFAARVENRTSDAAGLLLYVSLAEHFAEIRVDRQIAAVLPPATWETIIADFTQAMRTGPMVPAVIAALEKCAAALAPHFPPRPDQVNEISNRVTEF